MIAALGGEPDAMVPLLFKGRDFSRTDIESPARAL